MKGKVFETLSLMCKINAKPTQLTLLKLIIKCFYLLDYFLR